MACHRLGAAKTSRAAVVRWIGTAPGTGVASGASRFRASAASAGWLRSDCISCSYPCSASVASMRRLHRLGALARSGFRKPGGIAHFG
ncbi:hypothetical protein LL971_00680 [Xanthomonas campestris pv. parthenii]|nr:hypothetical protein [Xanthomonas campestris pv. parthenii]